MKIDSEVNWLLCRLNQKHRSLSAMDLDAFCCVCGGSNKDEINCLLECSRCFIKVGGSSYFFCLISYDYFVIISTIVVCRCIRLAMVFPEYLKVTGIADHAEPDLKIL